MSPRTFKLILLALTMITLGLIGPYLPPKWATTVTLSLIHI